MQSRKLILILICWVPICCSAQAPAANALKKCYDSIFNSLPADLKTMMTVFRSSKTGFALISKTIHDTLNKTDLLTKNIAQIEDMDSSNSNNDTGGFGASLFVGTAAFSKDTLYIYLQEGLMSSMSILHRITKNKVITTYHEWVKSDRAFKQKPWSPAETSILLNCITHTCILSTNQYTLGKKIYALVELITPEHFYLMDYNFSDNAIYRKLGWQYYIELTVTQFGHLKELIGEHYAKLNP